MTIIQAVAVGRKKIITLLNAATVPVVSGKAALENEKSTIQATVTGSGAVTATLLVEFSNDNVGWIPAGASPTISLSGTNLATDGFKVDAAWVYVHCELLSITGTDAAVTLTVGVR